MSLLFTLASELRAHLSSIGVEGVAADALIKETAAARHAWRVSQAVEAARAGAAEILRQRDLRHPELVGPGEQPGEGYTQEAHQGLALLLLLLDGMGVGGRCGVEGIDTDRVPAFRRCGRGRKQAYVGQVVVGHRQVPDQLAHGLAPS